MDQSTVSLHMPTPADVLWDDVMDMPRPGVGLDAWIIGHLRVCRACREYVAEGY